MAEYNIVGIRNNQKYLQRAIDYFSARWTSAEKFTMIVSATAW